MNITETMRKKLLGFQKNEITEHHIYSKLAHKVKSPENQKILADIADDELRHYRKWREYTEHDVEPDRLKIWKYYLISRVFGFTFGLKLIITKQLSGAFSVRSPQAIRSDGVGLPALPGSEQVDPGRTLCP